MGSRNHNPDTLTSMPRSWYDVPDTAAAMFSTCNQSISKRQLVDPLPPPIIRSDMEIDIYKRAALLRRQFPDLMYQVKPPQIWNDLYKYFDAVDLWIESPTFLFHVITSIWNTNKAIEFEQAGMIDRFAAEWVASNEELVVNAPDMKDGATLFTEAEWFYQTNKMNNHELLILGQTLTYHAQIARQKFRDAELRKLHNYEISRSQSVRPMQSFHPVGTAVPVIPEQAYPVPPHVQTYQAYAKPHAVIDGAPNAERPGQQVLPPAQSYDRFMENQRHIAVANPGSTPINLPNNTGNASRQNRPRGWSNETFRNLRGRPRPYGRYGNHQNQNFNHRNDRRTMPNTPQSSPPRQSASADPIYVLQSRRSSPPDDQGPIHAQRTASQPLAQNSQRIFSDPTTNGKDFSNDSMIQSSTNTQSRAQNSQASFTQWDIPFDGNPQAMINDSKNVSTFFYKGAPRKLQLNGESRRTVYVSGVEVRLFVSHALKEMMSECGEVDYISYLFGRPNNTGPAFVSFMHESSAELAIRRFDGYRLPSGRLLVVNYPENKRDRSNSYSSQSQRDFMTNSSSYPTSRDSDSRPVSRRPSLRNNSVSYRQFNGPLKSTASSSMVQSPPRSPLTIGFQSQLRPTQHAFETGKLLIETVQTIPAKQLQSSISEVLQHQSALNRMGQQAPLDNMENYSNISKKLVKMDHGGFQNNFSLNEPGEESRFDTPTRQREPRYGPYNRKENSPMKASAKDGTTSTTPRKQPAVVQASGNYSKSTAVKNKKKGPRQNTSTHPSPIGTPVKSRSEASMSTPAMIDNAIIGVPTESNAAHDQNTAASFSAEKLWFGRDSPTRSRLDPSHLVIAPVLEPSKADAPAVEGESITKKKQQEKKKNKKSTSKTESEGTLPRITTFTDLAEIASPTTTESIGYLASQNTNISFSNSSSYSSSRKPSVASGSSDTSLSATGAAQRQKGDVDSSFCTNTTEEDANLSIESTPLRMKSNSNRIISNGSTPKPRSAIGRQSHAKKISNASTNSNGSVRKADLQAPKADQITPRSALKSTIGDTPSITPNSFVGIVKSVSSQSEKDLAKTASTPTKSAKSSVCDGRKIDKLASSPGSLDDPAQWPALGPSKSPLSGIADGKPPPQVPIALPLSHRVASSGKPIVPALPLIKTRRPSFKLDAIGSEPWPFVKKCFSK